MKEVFNLLHAREKSEIGRVKQGFSAQNANERGGGGAVLPRSAAATTAAAADAPVGIVLQSAATVVADRGCHSSTVQMKTFPRCHRPAAAAAAGGVAAVRPNTITGGVDECDDEVDLLKRQQLTSEGVRDADDDERKFLKRQMLLPSRRVGCADATADVGDDQPRSPRSPHRCLLYTSPSPRDKRQSRMPSSA